MSDLGLDRRHLLESLSHLVYHNDFRFNLTSKTTFQDYFYLNTLGNNFDLDIK